MLVTSRRACESSAHAALARDGAGTKSANVGFLLDMKARAEMISFRGLSFGIVAVFCVCSLIACKKPEPQATPEAAIRAFYSMRIASGARGTPSIDELERLSPLISVELHDLLQEALLKHHKLASSSTPARRSFAEGDLFSSLFDGPTSLTVGAAEQLAGDEFLITVQLTSAKQLPALSWSDQVRVVREQGRYVVADIQYANHWAFGANTRLIRSLRAAMGKRSGVAA
jgi:hypothetical protein